MRTTSSDPSFSSRRLYFLHCLLIGFQLRFLCILRPAQHVLGYHQRYLLRSERRPGNSQVGIRPRRFPQKGIQWNAHQAQTPQRSTQGLFCNLRFLNFKVIFLKTRKKDIQDALDSADTNNDDVVDWDEWRSDLKLRGVPDAEIEAVFAKYDKDGDMVLNKEERTKLRADLLKQTAEIADEIDDVQDCGSKVT